MPGTITTDKIWQRAAELAGQSDRAAAIAELVQLAGDDRPALESARDRYAARLHGDGSDWAATAALTLLNRALSAYGWADPYDWSMRRKP